MAMDSGRAHLRGGRRGRPEDDQLEFDPETFPHAGWCAVPPYQSVPDTTRASRRGDSSGDTEAGKPARELSDAAWASTGIPATPPGTRWSEAMLLVGRFHQAFDLPRANRPTLDIPGSLAKLRVDLLVEEVGEFADATTARDLVGIADALADIVYVAYGAAITYGVDLDAALREVHRSNMSKLDEHGKPVYRDDGKVLKSARYTPPDISGVLFIQPPLPF